MHTSVIQTVGFRGVVVEPLTGMWARAWLSLRRDGIFAESELIAREGDRLIVRAPCPDGSELYLPCTTIAVRCDVGSSGVLLRLPALSERELARLERAARLPLPGWPKEHGDGFSSVPPSAA